MSNIDRALKALDEMGISYELAYHERVKSIKDCAVAEKLLGAVMPRNIFLCTANQKRFALLICRPDAVFRTSSVSKQANMPRLSFAPEDKLNEFLGTYPGAVSPLGLIYDKQRQVRLLIDKNLLQEENLLFHPLDDGCSLRMSMRAFTEGFLGRLGYVITSVNME